MNSRAGSLLLFLLIAAAVSASGDDRQNAEKQVRRIAAMATDKVGRRMVSMTLADGLKIPRPDLVEERRKIALDYGSYFVARELVAGGATIAEIAVQLKSGKTIWQIAEGQHADWKQIASDARKQNNRIEDRIYRHFLNKRNTEKDDERDQAEKYTIWHDAVRTDFNVSEPEMIEAQQRYIFWRDLAGKAQASGSMDPLEKRAAAMDHADSRHDTHGISAPAAGGLPPQ